MSTSLADRIALLSGEGAFEVLARATELERRGRSIIHLEIGQPDFPTPQHIQEAATKAMADGFTGYTPSNGLIECREAIAEDASQARGVEISPECVVVTPGAKPIIFFGMLALVNPGDEVIYPDPGFPIYASCIRFAGGIPVPVPLREERQFRLDPEELASLVTPRTRLVLINSPHNPTGSALLREDVERLCEVCLKNDLFLMSDEPYRRVIYGEKFYSPLSVPGMAERTLVIDGLSKTYSMTGWRMGFGIGPREVVDAIAMLEVNCNSCTTAFVQMAAIAALRGPQNAAEAMVAEFRRRRDLIVEGLNAIPGISCVLPIGAFYAWPNVSQCCGPDLKTFAVDLLMEAG
ncbi:MAG: pyridoxal phosphate-dependent aminotransferase, partial [Candidatus Zipacnadales bacterium]